MGGDLLTYIFGLPLLVGVWFVYWHFSVAKFLIDILLYFVFLAMLPIGCWFMAIFYLTEGNIFSALATIVLSIVPTILAVSAWDPFSQSIRQSWQKIRNV